MKNTNWFLYSLLHLCFFFTPFSILAQDGSLDLSFDLDGIVKTDFGSSDELWNSIALQNDQKIIAAGSFFKNTHRVVALARFNPDGSLDQSFDGDGKVEYDPGSNQNVLDIAIQADGKILVVGGYSSSDIFMARFLANGSLDTAFDSDGICIADLGGFTETAFSVQLQSDQKILIGAYSAPSASVAFTLARFMPDGKIDSTFSQDGIVRDYLNSNTAVLKCLQLQNDGKILAAGHRSNGINNDIAIQRYTSEGTLDSSFATNGTRIEDLGDWESANSICILADGRILIGASTGPGSGPGDFVCLRYLSNGSPDLSFNSSGHVITDMGGHDVINSVRVLNSGYPLLGGDDGNGKFALSRFKEDGSLDTGFGQNGKVLTNIGQSRDMILQNDGKILMAGFFDNSGLTDFCIVRYLQSNPAGLHEILKKESIRIYPNPVKDLLVLELESAAQLSLTDVSGKELLNLSLSAGLNQLPFHFNEGFYLLKIEDQKGELFIQKILKH